MDPNFRIEHSNIDEELKRITTADSDIIRSKNQLEKTTNFLKKLVSTFKKPHFKEFTEEEKMKLTSMMKRFLESQQNQH